jgi:hypothetical protein
MNIIIANTIIHQDADGNYCLNDLHKAAGNTPKHRPSEWLRGKQTQELVDEISKAGIRGLTSIQGGSARGTYGCRELVYAYATWISPAFFLKVIRTYDALVTAPVASQAPALPEIITPANLQSMLDKPMQITVREYLALTQGQQVQPVLPSAGRTYKAFLTVGEREEIIRLHEVEKMTPINIAEITGTLEDTVRTILYRHSKAKERDYNARKALKKGGAA